MDYYLNEDIKKRIIVEVELVKVELQSLEI
jgi:hypothetical protein